MRVIIYLLLFTYFSISSYAYANSKLGGPACIENLVQDLMNAGRVESSGKFTVARLRVGAEKQVNQITLTANSPYAFYVDTENQANPFLFGIFQSFNVKHNGKNYSGLFVTKHTPTEITFVRKGIHGAGGDSSRYFTFSFKDGPVVLNQRNEGWVRLQKSFIHQKVSLQISPTSKEKISGFLISYHESQPDRNNNSIITIKILKDDGKIFIHTFDEEYDYWPYIQPQIGFLIHPN